MKYPFLAGQIFDTPLMVRPEAAELFANGFVNILVGNVQVAAPAGAPPARESFASQFVGTRYKGKPYAMTDSGIAIMPVHGALAQRAGDIDANCMPIESYERLGRMFSAMQADPDVRAILMEIDSPGGQVAGNFELGRRIMSARGTKPVWAHANEIAFSGGYSLGSSAERLYTPDTGMVGSIGVIMLHMSQAERDAKAGYKYTAIFAGNQKNDFNPHIDLTDAARARLQAMVDTSYQIFVDHVAAARGISADAVRATQAGTFEAKPALDAKLIDGIATFADTLGALEKRLTGATTVVPGAGLAAHQPQETAMSEPNKPAATEQPKPAEKQPEQPAASVDAAKATADAKSRISAILALDEAKGRTEMAQHIALETDLSVEDAKKMLAKSPLPAPGKAGSGFTEAMRAGGNPKVGAGGGDGEQTTEELVKGIVAHIPKSSK